MVNGIMHKRKRIYLDTTIKQYNISVLFVDMVYLIIKNMCFVVYRSYKSIKINCITNINSFVK